MRISRSSSYRFQSQDFEYISPMASVTVDSADLGISEDDLLKFTEEQMAQHVKDLGEFCAEVLEDQLRPHLEEADKLCFPKSAAHDVADYHEGVRA